jgi:hypothetical protein
MGPSGTFEQRNLCARELLLQVNSGSHLLAFVKYVYERHLLAELLITISGNSLPHDIEECASSYVARGRWGRNALEGERA